MWHGELEILEAVGAVRDGTARVAAHVVALLSLEQVLDKRAVRRALEVCLDALAKHRPELMHVLLARDGAPLEGGSEAFGRHRVLRVA